jgi:hypothetical protein
MKRITLVALILTACGGGSTHPVSIDQFPTRFAAAYCKRIFACCKQSEIPERLSLFNPSPTDEAGCTTDYAGLITLIIPQAQTAITSGRLRYDPQGAGECIDAYAGLSCAQFSAATTESTLAGRCDHFFVPLVADGGSCDLSSECTSHYCDSVPGSRVDGTCKTKPQQGEPCPAFECADGLICSAGATSSTCQPKKADGQPCYSASECQSNGCEGANASTATMGTCGAPAVTCQGG